MLPLTKRYSSGKEKIEKGKVKKEKWEKKNESEKKSESENLNREVERCFLLPLSGFHSRSSLPAYANLS